MSEELPCARKSRPVLCVSEGGENGGQFIEQLSHGQTHPDTRLVVQRRGGSGHHSAGMYGALALSGVGLDGFKSLPTPKFCNSMMKLDSNPEKGFFLLEVPLACLNERHHELGNELSSLYEGLIYHTF